MWRRKLCGAGNSEKCQYATGSQKSSLHQIIFFGPAKVGREGFAGLRLRLSLLIIVAVNCMFLLLATGLKKVTKTTQDVCTVLVVSLNTTLERTIYYMRNNSMDA